MKKYTARIIVCAMCAGMLLTMICFYRTIGGELIDWFRGHQDGMFAKIDDAFSSIESGWNKGLFLKAQAVDVYGGIQKLMGNEVIRDADESKTVVLGSDGKLYFAGNVTGDDNAEAKWRNMERLADIHQHLSNRGVDFLFAIAPDKYCSAEVSLPVEVHDYYDDMIEVEERLMELGVPCLNLQRELNEDYECYSDGFFVTDHHWNIETAFWGYAKICAALNAISDLAIDEKYYSQQSYNTRIVEDTVLGSMGTRVGRLYAGMDDIAVISPQFQTDFIVEYSSKTLHAEVTRSGSFEEAILTPEAGYNMYITSDNPFIHVDNHLISEGKRILLLKDSFGVPVAAWLACVADELVIMDLRYAQEKSVYEYIEEYSIDTVIMLYNPGMLGTEYVSDFEHPSTGK